MAVIRNNKTGMWEVRTYYKDLTGARKQKTKRGFAKKSEALEWERNFKLKEELRIVEQKRFVVGGAKYTEDLKRFHQLQDEYLLIVNNDIKSVVDLVDFINEQEELDELKQEKRKIKRQIQLADDIIKEDLYTAYYAVSGKEEIVADREIEIPGMEEKAAFEEDVAVEPETNVVVMNPDNIQNEIGRQKEQADRARKQQTGLEGIGIPEVHNSPDVNVARVGENITDVTDKNGFVETRETEPVDKVDWIVRRITELGGYENVSDSVKADIFGFDIADVSGSIRLFSDVMKKLGIKLDGDELYEEFQKIYEESVGRDADKDNAEDKMWNRGRGR